MKKQGFRRRFRLYRKKLLRPMLGAVLIGLLRWLGCWRLSNLHRLGNGLGWLLYWGIPTGSLARVARRNLSMVFPVSQVQREQLLRKNLQETAKVVLELGAMWTWSGVRILRLITAVCHEEQWRAALALGRGGILITPHLGAWEVAGLYASASYPTTTLYRPSRLGLDPLIREGRESLGAKIVPTDAQGVKSLLAALKKHEVLGILPDQDAEQGVFSPFLGVTASTMTLVSRLAMRTGCPVFLLYAERLPDAQGYRLYFEALPSTIATASSLAESVAVLNRSVEAAIYHLPEQYLWTYRRFKKRPTGVAHRYHSVKEMARKDYR